MGNVAWYRQEQKETLGPLRIRTGRLYSASLMPTSGWLLQIIMSQAKSSLSSTTLTAVYILITLQLLFQVLSFTFLIVDQ